ncbi:hypothetical protein H8356DRAFT_1387797 [Neocallimastix lanati (nom. inval.)]|nr:hypothetical protein H8356DRAFT_1387797 [Neocallimastix sp. JGI-2020a]
MVKQNSKLKYKLKEKVTNSRKNRIERIQYNSKDDNMCGGDLYFSDDVDQKKIKIGGVFCINEISKQRIVVDFINK